MIEVKTINIVDGFIEVFNRNKLANSRTDPN